MVKLRIEESERGVWLVNEITGEYMRLASRAEITRVLPALRGAMDRWFGWFGISECPHCRALKPSLEHVEDCAKRNGEPRG